MKLKLEKRFGDKIRIVPSTNPSNSSTVVSGNITLDEAIAAAKKANDSLESSMIENVFQIQAQVAEPTFIKDAACLIHSDVVKCKGLSKEEILDCQN